MHIPRYVRGLVFAFVVLTIASSAMAQVRISVNFGPPALPIYEQPICPGDGYLWTPGYWAWDGDDYYWVPGTWVMAPEVGYFWTPPYWAWENDSYVFYDGWWGPQVGFYGGIAYGFGYFGVGFVGGRWDGGHFFYNRSVTNINVVNIHNVYEERVNVVENHVSFNGGPGGIVARPRPEEEAAMRERHLPPVAAQVQHMNTARGNPELRASANHGRPPIAATANPGSFSGHGVLAAKEAGGAYNPPANRGGEGSRAAVHPNDLPAYQKTSANTGDAKRDQKYQQQQEKMMAKQQQERQKLQQQQDREHQQMERQNADATRRQQMEVQHQQQTAQLQQRHMQQQQQLQQRYEPHKR